MAVGDLRGHDDGVGADGRHLGVCRHWRRGGHRRAFGSAGITIAAGVAVCNGPSSAQLAASQPVSGGTYEYLHPSLGFTAGWMFLPAKSASAATAALGFGGYLLHVLQWSNSRMITIVAMIVSVLVTLLVSGGLKRSNWANVLIVSLALLSLAVFAVFSLPFAWERVETNLLLFFPRGDGSPGAFLELCALMFVAYTGHGRIATMGEEVREPQGIIPRAIIAAMMVPAFALHRSWCRCGRWLWRGSVGSSNRPGVGSARDRVAGARTSGRRDVGRHWGDDGHVGRAAQHDLGSVPDGPRDGGRHDLPDVLARIDRTGSTPTFAVIAAGILVTALAALGDVRLSWSFSAFTLLVYYAITNLAALRLR